MSKLSSKEMQVLLEDAKHMLAARARTLTQGQTDQWSVWRHYKGGVYRVDGFEIDTNDGSLRVRYQRIAGPDYQAHSERGIVFSRPIAEWVDDVDVTPTAAPPPADPVETWTVPRFQPVFEIKRWETIQEQIERSA